MTLAHGRAYRAIPGPSVIPDRVLNAMHQAAPNIYEGPLIALTERVVHGLKRVARTEGSVAMYIANGHGAWEAALANTLAPGDRVLVLASGRFAIGWGEMATCLGASVETLDAGNRAPIAPEAVADRLRADLSHPTPFRAILVVQTDTATSVRNDIDAIGQALRSTGHPALFMVDCIASLGSEPFEMDRWGVDVMVAGCQKGLMTPPGLGFVFYTDRAATRRRALTRVSSYWDWQPRTDPDAYYRYFCGTAPTHHLFGLETALIMLLDEEGLEAAWARHTRLASAVWAAVEVWGSEGNLALNIPVKAARSTAVTGICTTAGMAEALRHWCETEAGLTLGIGLGLDGADAPAPGGLFRVGHMGHLNPPMILGALATIEAGLKSLAIPHGPAALDAAAAALTARAGATIPQAAE